MVDNKKMNDRLGGDVANRSETVEGIRDTAQAVLDKAGDYAHQAKDKAGEYANQAKEKVGEFAHQAREKVGEWAGEAGEKAQKWAGEAYDATAHGVSDFGREVTMLVRKHPLPSILIGFGLGLLLGRAARAV